MSIRELRAKNCLEDLFNEITNLKRAADHLNVIKLVDEQWSKENFYLFFEFCNGGSLSMLKELPIVVTEGIVRSIAL